jgi:hypothetical protein
MRRHLYYYTHLEHDLPTASALLAGDPGLWLPLPAEPTAGGWAVDLVASGALPRAVSHHGAIVDVGPALASEDRMLRTVTWRSATAPGIFPVFDGDLELIRLQGDLCQLSLIGTYRPPLAVAGGAGDALLGHHVAEACIRRFVLDMAERMVGVTLGA